MSTTPATAIRAGFLAACFLFVLSHILPAFHAGSDESGWWCWRVTISQWVELPSEAKDVPIWFQYLLLSLASPAFVLVAIARFRLRAVRPHHWTNALTIGAMLVVISWPITCLLYEGIDDIRIGYWVWLVSFLGLFATLRTLKPAAPETAA